MSVLISKEDTLKRLCEKCTEGDETLKCDIMKCIEYHLIEDMPSADRPTGKWVEHESDHIEKVYLCSNCEDYEAWGETEKTPYCPNCGARMEVDDIRDYEAAVEQMEHDILYEPTYNPDGGSM